MPDQVLDTPRRPYNLPAQDPGWLTQGPSRTGGGWLPHPCQDIDSPSQGLLYSAGVSSPNFIEYASHCQNLAQPSPNPFLSVTAHSLNINIEMRINLSSIILPTCFFPGFTKNLVGP